MKDKVRATPAIMLYMDGTLDEEIVLIIVNEFEAQNIVVFVFGLDQKPSI